MSPGESRERPVEVLLLIRRYTLFISLVFAFLNQLPCSGTTDVCVDIDKLARS